MVSSIIMVIVGINIVGSIGEHSTLMMKGEKVGNAVKVVEEACKRVILKGDASRRWLVWWLVGAMVSSINKRSAHNNRMNDTAAGRTKLELLPGTRRDRCTELELAPGTRGHRCIIVVVGRDIGHGQRKKS